MNRIKKMPIFYPIFFLINALVVTFVYLPQWLFGAWWCEDCNKRYGIKDEPISTQAADICKECYKEKYGGIS